MAKYTVTYKCGHQDEVTLFGKVEDRMKRLEWLAAQDCPDCKRQQAEDKAAGSNMQGTAKQIAWAEDIKKTYLTNIDELAAKVRTSNWPAEVCGIFGKILEGKRQQAETILDATAWIDNREVYTSQKALQRSVEAAANDMINNPK